MYIQSPPFYHFLSYKKRPGRGFTYVCPKGHLPRVLHFAPDEGEESYGLLPLDRGQAGSFSLLKLGAVGFRTATPRGGLSPPLPEGKGLPGTSGLTQIPGLGALALWLAGHLGNAGRGLCSLPQLSLFFSRRRCLVSQPIPTAEGCLRETWGEGVCTEVEIVHRETQRGVPTGPTALIIMSTRDYLFNP